MAFCIIPVNIHLRNSNMNVYPGMISKRFMRISSTNRISCMMCRSKRRRITVEIRIWMSMVRGVSWRMKESWPWNNVLCVKVCLVIRRQIEMHFVQWRLFLEKQTTLPTNIELIDETTTTATESVKPSFLESLRDEIKRYGTYLREKFWEIIERIGGKFKQLGSKISSLFKR